MPIDPAALARNLSSLATLDAEHDLPRALQQLASAAKTLLRVDGAGLMLARSSASSSSCWRSHMPAVCESRSRRQQVIPEP